MTSKLLDLVEYNSGSNRVSNLKDGRARSVRLNDVYDSSLNCIGRGPVTNFDMK